MKQKNKNRNKNWKLKCISTCPLKLVFDLNQSNLAWLIVQESGVDIAWVDMSANLIFY